MSTAWNNPLIEQRADPQISLVDGRYWFTASVPSYDAIEIRASDSIAGLATAPTKVIWRRHESGPMSFHVWAPELHRIDGRWFVYFAASERDDIWKLRMYVLECLGQDPLTGEWIERGQIATPEEGFSLDATPFEHGGRRMWTLEGFNIFDTEQVSVELLSASVTVTSPGEIDLYVKAFAELSAMAVFGAPARHLIAGAIAALD